MGFLNLFSKPAQPPAHLPSGTFTVDRAGQILVATLPSSFPKDLLSDIGQRVIKAFQEAQTAQLPLNELIIQYSSLKIVARELRGGAIVFLTPQALTAPVKKPEGVNL
jgi:hypothetical protein